MIPDFAEAIHLARSSDLPMLGPLFERTKKVAEGVAPMAEMRMKCQVEKVSSNLLPNQVINDLLQARMGRLRRSRASRKRRARRARNSRSGS